MADFEAVLEEVGTFGVYQVTVFILVSLFETPAAWAMVLPVFTTSTPHWACNMTNSSMNGLNMSSGECPTNGHCDIIYTESRTSTISEWELTCTSNQSFASTLLRVIQMAGVFVGAFIVGQLADSFGRRKVLFVVYGVMLALSLASSFSTSWQMYTTFRFFIGGAIGGTMVVNFVLPIELVGKKWRTFCGCIGFWAVGIATLPILAYLLPNWRHLSIVCSVLGVPLLFTYWIVPESPRWLISKGRYNEAQSIIDQIAKRNKRSVHTKLHPDTESTVSVVAPPNYTYWDLFRTPGMTRNTLIITYTWFVCGCVYYGTTFGVEHLSGNLYLNLFLSGIVEIPPLIFVVLVNNKIGRKITLGILMSLAGSSLLAVLVIDVSGKKQEQSVLTSALSHVGKAGIAGAWAAVQVSSAELFPTSIRNIGVSVSSMSARVGAVLAPQIANLSDSAVALPYLIYSSLCLVSVLLCILLPETLGQPLPDTVPPWTCNSCSTVSLPDDDDEQQQQTTQEEDVELMETSNGAVVT